MGCNQTRPSYSGAVKESMSVNRNNRALIKENAAGTRQRIFIILKSLISSESRTHTTSSRSCSHKEGRMRLQQVRSDLLIHRTRHVSSPVHSYVSKPRVVLNLIPYECDLH